MDFNAILRRVSTEWKQGRTLAGHYERAPCAAGINFIFSPSDFLLPFGTIHFELWTRRLLLLALLVANDSSSGIER